MKLVPGGVEEDWVGISLLAGLPAALEIFLRLLQNVSRVAVSQTENPKKPKTKKQEKQKTKKTEIHKTKSTKKLKIKK